MKTTILALLAILCAHVAFAQQADDLTVTLPTGKVITFQTLEQKTKFEAARSRVQQTRVQTEAQSTAATIATANAGQQTAARATPTPSSSHTGAGIGNNGAPMFTSDYYMGAPDTWVGKQVTISVAYITPRNQADRDDGMHQLDASTWGRTGGGVVDQNPGGSLIILASPEAAMRLLQLCGSSLQFNAGGVKTMFIKGEFTVLVRTTGAAAGTKEYGVIVKN